MIYPIVAGKGKRIFKDEETLIKLKLVSATKTESGITIVIYEPNN